MFRTRSFWTLLSLSLLMAGAIAPLPLHLTWAQAETPENDASAESGDPDNDAANGVNDNGSTMQPFEEVTDGLQKQEGVFTLYSDLEQGKAYLALRPEQLNRNFLLMATLESGVGEAGLFRGWPVNDLLIQFREAPGDRLQVVVPNTYLRNGETGLPGWQQRLLDTSFSDSVLFPLNIVSEDPETGAFLVDLSALLLERDLINTFQRFSAVMGAYAPNPELSHLDSLQVFPENLEIGVTRAFSGGGGMPETPMAGLFGINLQGLADARGFSLRLRYSFSSLPTGNGYQPRQADERVGYFLSVHRAPLQAQRQDPFVRYINRWHLEKQDPEAEVSPPREPIVFWIENTVPPEYRETIREGVLLWNQAFAEIGFENAIEVRQMPNDADWDPADVRYNVIRWSDSLRPWAIGLGPSRVNPLTGQILDADIILDANTIRLLQRQYQTRGLDSAPEAEQYLQLCGERSQTWYLQWLTIQQYGEAGLDPALWQDHRPDHTSTHLLTDDHCAGYTAGQRLAFGALALSVLPRPDLADAALDEFIHQYLRALTAHEVGHTLGLRHNFAGSRLLPPEALNDPETTRSQGMVSSIMDYFPPNIAPPGVVQGEFFPTRLGPYDHWAIAYGYQPVPRSPLQRQEQQVLEQIAQQGGTAELAYATDEDIYDFIDPEVNAWDLSSDPLQFAQWQLQNAHAVWERLDRLSVSPGEGYGSLRQRVDLVFGYYRGNALTITDYVGGQRFRRLDPWDSEGQAPFEPIPAEKQRQALATLNEYVFNGDAFEFSPQLLNQLAPDRWRHWGVSLTTYPLDYPIYDRVLVLQSMVMSELMYADRLARLRDAELKSPEEDTLTLAELFETLHQSVWREVREAEDTPPDISSLRRGLQRHHLNILSNLVLRRSFWDALSAQSFTDFMALASTVGAPEDARVLARYQLRQIRGEVEQTLDRHDDRLPVTTRAHLEDVRDRITQVLEAPLLGM